MTRILARILYSRRYAELTQRAEELTRRIYLRRVQHKEWKSLASEKAQVMHERMALELKMGINTSPPMRSKKQVSLT